MPALMIGTYFKRPNSPVTMPNEDGSVTTYFFRPLDPNNKNSEHVAVVENAAHAQRFLSIKEGYYLSDAQATVEAASAAASKLAKPKAAPSADAKQAPTTSAPADEAAPTAKPTDVGQVIETDLAAVGLLDLPLKAFKAALQDTPQIVLRAALRIESEKKEDDVRPTYVRALEAELKA